MGKRAKEHRKKVQKRNDKINQEKQKMDKYRRAIIEQIMRERDKGAFDSPKELPDTSEEGNQSIN